MADPMSADVAWAAGNEGLVPATNTAPEFAFSATVVELGFSADQATGGPYDGEAR
jgi:hypothetical protein